MSASQAFMPTSDNTQSGFIMPHDHMQEHAIQIMQHTNRSSTKFFLVLKNTSLTESLPNGIFYKDSVRVKTIL